MGQMLKDSDKDDDVVLWKRMKSGDHGSFSKIFKSYYSKLYSYGIKLKPFPDFVRDQVQDLFVYIWQNRESLSDVSNLKAYLFTSLRRRIFLQKNNRVQTNLLDSISDEETQALVFDPGEFVDRELVSVNLKEKLIKNLNALPVYQREIIFLRFYHHLTYGEIAGVINIKEQSVKNNMPHIFQKLADGIDIPKEDIHDLDIMLFNLFLLFKKK